MSSADTEEPEMSSGTLQQQAQYRAPAFLRAPFTRSTFRELGYTLTGLPVALAGFVFAVTLFALGAGLIVTALGFPVLALLLAGARGFGALERERARTMLATEVAAPAGPRPRRPGFWGFVSGRLSDPAGWRAVLYQVLMFPWGVLSFAVSVIFTLVGWVLALFPLYNWVFPTYTDWPGYRLFDYGDHGVRHVYYITSPAQMAAVSAVGILVVLLTPQLLRGLTNVNRLAVRGLLGAR